MEKGKRERMTDRLCYISFCQMFHDKDEVEAPGHGIYRVSMVPFPPPSVHSTCTNLVLAQCGSYLVTCGSNGY